ncbi:MAG: IS1595 family transposase [Hyphomicrobium sp.]|nr:MAG: IS1595 family transposase [Hyphomicrobium sp.]PPD00492.1 MAG: IS1595 family transposase [Hyphomicrobium sp.]
MSILTKKYFHDEAAAFVKLESIVWPHGPVCPHCGADKRVYELNGVRSKPSKKNPEGIERHGLKKCGACRKQFTARVGTVFESSHIPLHKWLQAVHLMCSSKKGISSHQLHRVLEIKYQSAWFMSHRIREAMRTGSLSPMGGAGGIVEVDETIYGRADTHPKGRRRNTNRKITNSSHKNVIVSLVERGGSVRSYHVSGSTVSEVIPIVNANVSKETAMMTDGSPLYKQQLGNFASHDRVDHSANEYVRYEPTKTVHTNTVEGYFSVFKRGMRGTYQHCKEKHLHRYLAEFDFRHNNRSALGTEDEKRADRALAGAKGKRLTYTVARPT